MAGASNTSKEKKKKLLLRLNTLVLIGTIAYAIIDKYLGIEVAAYIYLGFIGFTGINYILIRRDSIEAVKFISLLVFNILIYVVASSEPFETGMHLQFVSVGAVALALYGYEQWKWAIGFILLSVTLDILVFKVDVTLIPAREVDAMQAQFFLVLNTLLAASVSVFTILLISKYNFDAERTLKAREAFIRKQNDELTKANEELDRFVYSASHDLRAPLSTLEGLINLIEKETDRAQVDEYIEFMKQRIGSMNTFIHEIVDYSRNARIALTNEPISIFSFIKEIYNEFQFMPNWEQISVRWDIKPDLVIHTDKVRLRMILSNIISNSIRYIDPKKSKSIIEIKGHVKDKQVLITIKDNGVGISQAYQSKVFDMFFRANDTSQGSGLGLYIAKEAASKLSGTLQLESEEKIGTICTITFPVSKVDT